MKTGDDKLDVGCLSDEITGVASALGIHARNRSILGFTAGQNRQRVRLIGVRADANSLRDPSFSLRWGAGQQGLSFLYFLSILSCLKSSFRISSYQTLDGQRPGDPK
jgi:hypothetical protein